MLQKNYAHLSICELSTWFLIPHGESACTATTICVQTSVSIFAGKFCIGIQNYIQYRGMAWYMHM